MVSELSEAPVAAGKSSVPVETLTLKDGRTLAYARYGAKSDSKTIPVFYFNGTPGSTLECSLVDRAALALGIPFISTDRPGFGESSFQENRTLLSWPKDILELADHLDIPKFGVMGLSGGGPYVLACLHEIPKERLVAATIVSGMYPYSLGTEGMMWQTRSLFWIAGLSTWLAEKMIDFSMGKMLREPDQQKMIDQLMGQTDTLPQPQADKDTFKEVLKDPVLTGAYLGSMKAALKTSSKGAAWEFKIMGADYGFKLEDLDAERLTIWHGALDVNVPVGMPDKVSKLLPKTDYKRMENDGHISLIVRHNEDILSMFVKKL